MSSLSLLLAFHTSSMYIHVCISVMHCVTFSVSDEDFESFNNVTVGTASQAVLTPFISSHCFTITLLARPDDGLDDRTLFVSLRAREGCQ